MRTVQLSITLTMLAVPASAFALSKDVSPDTQDPAALPVKVTPDSVALGDGVTVAGRVSSSDAGRQIVLESAPGARGDWRRLASTRVGRAGGYRFRFHPERSGTLRAVLPAASGRRSASRRPGFAASVGGREVTRSVSRAAPVEVKASMSVEGRAHDVLAGEATHISGRLAPGRPGRRVDVQALAGARWRTVAHGRTGVHGGFSVRYRPAADAGRHLRVRFAGDRYNGGATDGAGSLVTFVPELVSWYDDAGSTACGFHAADGVANRTLPCGTKVLMRHGGRTVTATVDDRGPYVYPRDFDLSQSTAAALGFSGVGTVQTSVQ